MPDNNLLAQLGNTAFAFRGYNVSNFGRTPELLAHSIYGSIVEAYLREASQLCADVIKRPVDLVARLRAGRETRGLEEYAEDVALIVAMEIAQVRLLDEFFGLTLPLSQSIVWPRLILCSALVPSVFAAAREEVRGSGSGGPKNARIFREASTSSCMGDVDGSPATAAFIRKWATFSAA